MDWGAEEKAETLKAEMGSPDRFQEAHWSGRKISRGVKSLCELFVAEIPGPEIRPRSGGHEKEQNLLQ
jgi:hypothetical protein